MAHADISEIFHKMEWRSMPVASVFVENNNEIKRVERRQLHYKGS